jgi:hypothetical protein
MNATTGAEAAARPFPGTAEAPNTRRDLRLLAYWISLGAAAGGLAGLLAGGVAGRLAMLLLRLTSDDSVRGIQSDDDFTIGRVTADGTFSLLMVTAVLGAVVGLIVVAGRPFLPKRRMPIAWGVAGAITGGALLVHGDGVDFTLLEPHWLAVALFVVIPAAGASLAAWFAESWRGWWWKRRMWTAIASIAAIPALMFFVWVPVAIVGAVWLFALQYRSLRALPGWLPTRIAAVCVFAAVVLLGALDLVMNDVRQIL